MSGKSLLRSGGKRRGIGDSAERLTLGTLGEGRDMDKGHVIRLGNDPSLVLWGLIPWNRTTHESCLHLTFPESSFQKVGRGWEEREQGQRGGSVWIFDLKRKGFRSVFWIFMMRLEGDGKTHPRPIFL